MSRNLIVVLGVAGLICAETATAQGLSGLNQRLGFCDAQTAPAKRATCFEKLARDALKIMENPVLASQPAAAAQPDKANPYADLISKAKANITREFKDPATVQWRNLFVTGGMVPVLCGELNGRNSYGAYVGYRRFYATENPALQGIEDPKDPALIVARWASMCGFKAADINADGTVTRTESPGNPAEPVSTQKAGWIVAMAQKNGCDGKIRVRSIMKDGVKEKFEATCTDKTIEFTCDFSKPVLDEFNGIPMVRGDAGYIQAACWL